MGRFRVLDGWRGISILAVLACHFLPLGPKRWDLNVAAGVFGMAIFFTLSGFLITSFLLHRANVGDFLIRRLCRILPLAWLALAIGLAMAHATGRQVLANFLFVANFPPFYLTQVTAHFWSLCVEVQFYAAIALVSGLWGKRGLLVAVPAGCLAITALRVHAHEYQSIVTYYRADEILSGAILALLHAGELGERARGFLARCHPLILAPLFVLSTHPAFGWTDYLRSYLAAAMVGGTLGMSESNPFARVLSCRPLAYIAEISYALYVWHPLVADTWLGSGAKLVKYLKRPLLFAAVWAVAHASTFWYEQRWIAWGRRLSMRRPERRARTASPTAT